MEGQTRSRSNSSSNESPGQAVKQLSIYQVLASPCLKEALKWYAVSVFAFENIFFVDKVRAQEGVVPFSRPSFRWTVGGSSCLQRE